MIKYKSIAVENSDDLNTFVKKNMPILSKENTDNGISLHNGYFIIRYEDGTFNEKATGLSDVRQILNSYRHNVVTKTITVQSTEHEMRNLFPKETIDTLEKKDKNWFRDFFVAKGLSSEHANKWADGVIKQLRDRFLANYEVEQYKEVSIPIMEAIEKSYE